MSLSALALVALVTWIGPEPRPALPDDPKPLCGHSVANLARHGTFAESTHSYNVRHYRLDFDLPMTNAGYRCHEQVSLMSEVPVLDTFSLDFDALVCDSVKQDGEPLVFNTPSGLLWVALHEPVSMGDSTTIDIFFHRESTASSGGYFYAQPPRIRYAHGMTCGCPTDNHFWFACYDHPSDKAERGTLMNFTLPDTFQTCTNGVLDSITQNTDGTATHWWSHPYPISTYLMTFSASRFASWDTWFLNTNGDTIPVVHWMWPEDSAATRNGYRRLPEMLDYFVRPEIYDAYPFRRFGHVPGYFGFPWGGMEHQTLVMLNTGYIGGGHESTIAHELSHMWWGDMVTHVGYADVWLNEGFATYAECICMGALNGRNYFNTFIRGKAGAYYSSDRTGRMPLYDPPWNRIYDYGHIYCKGAWVQHTLRWVMGDTAWDQPGVFFEAQRAYGDSFRYGTVSTDDYQRICEQFHGEDLSWFFDEWIYQAGYPKYHIDWTSEPVGDSFRVIIEVAQSNGNLAPDFFRTPLPVRINCLYVDTTVTVRPDANPSMDTFLVHACPESLTVDPDNWILDSVYLTGIAEGAPGGPPRARLLEATPNPGSNRLDFQLNGPPGAMGRLAIFDRTGRIVAALPWASGTDGRTHVTWHRTDGMGRRVPAGVYFARVDHAEPATKLVLLD